MAMLVSEREEGGLYERSGKHEGDRNEKSTRGLHRTDTDLRHPDSRPLLLVVACLVGSH